VAEQYSITASDSCWFTALNNCHL